MSIIDLNKSATAEPVTSIDIFQVCRDTIVAAACLGHGLGLVATRLLDDEKDSIADFELFANLVYDDNGQISAVDTPVLINLVDEAINSIKQWARDMKRFYNQELLGDIVLDQHIRAFNAGQAEHELGKVLVTLAKEFQHTI